MEGIVRKVFLILGIGVSISRCEPPVPNSQYGVPGNFGAGHTSNVGNGIHGDSGEVTNSYGAPLNGAHDAHQDYVDSQPKSYEFGYAVKDAVSGNDFGRRETSDGDTVRGEYRVQLPDGRTQIVTYTADWRTGFHADVRYEGVASYPDQYNTNNNNNNYNNNKNNNNNNNNANGYNNGGSGYNDLNTNAGFGNTNYNGGGSIDQGYNSNSYHGLNNNGNYNSGFNNGANNNNNNNNHNHNHNHNYDTNGHNYNGNGNTYSQINSLDESTGYNNYAGYSSNSFGIKAPTPTYGTPAFH